MQRLIENARRKGFDAYLASSGQNVAYMSGFWSPGLFLGFEPSFAIMPAQEGARPTVVAPMGPMDMVADENLQFTNLVVYGRFFTHIPRDLDAGSLSAADTRLHGLLAKRPASASVPDKWEALAGALRDLGLSRSHIAVDETGFSPEDYQILHRRLPDAKLTSASSEFRWVRMVKTPEEVTRLRKAASITLNAILEALKTAREGVTEFQMGQAFSKALIDGSATPASLALAFGARTSHPNSQPQDTRLGRGQLIRFDVGCRYKLYYTDMARIACLGEPPAKARKYYACLKEGQEAGLAALKPGVVASEIFDTTMAAARSCGLAHYERHNVGHGIGIDFYDLPFLAAKDDTVIEKNMVLCVETPYYELGFGGLQTEDMVLVTDTGNEVLTPQNRDLIVV